jgi:hypothetical protein
MFTNKKEKQTKKDLTFHPHIAIFSQGIKHAVLSALQNSYKPNMLSSQPFNTPTYQTCCPLSLSKLLQTKHAVLSALQYSYIPNMLSSQPFNTPTNQTCCPFSPLGILSTSLKRWSPGMLYTNRLEGVPMYAEHLLAAFPSLCSSTHPKSSQLG